MDRDFLTDLFADFGPVSIRRMFSGFGISLDGTNFALALRGSLYLRADEQSIPRFEAEGKKPFQYQTKNKTVTVGSYWQLPERLYDDPAELSDWARVALAAAQRAALRKPAKKRRRAGPAGGGSIKKPGLAKSTARRKAVGKAPGKKARRRKPSS